MPCGCAKGGRLGSRLLYQDGHQLPNSHTHTHTHTAVHPCVATALVTTAAALVTTAATLAMAQITLPLFLAGVHCAGRANPPRPPKQLSAHGGNVALASACSWRGKLKKFQHHP